jgi:hypothetical protein
MTDQNDASSDYELRETIKDLPTGDLRHRTVHELRIFRLVRDVDPTGISGTGTVAEGVEFTDGTVALRWTSTWPTSVVFHERGMESVLAIHGHGGNTRVVWVDEVKRPGQLEPLVNEVVDDPDGTRDLPHPYIPLGPGVSDGFCRRCGRDSRAPLRSAVETPPLGPGHYSVSIVDDENRWFLKIVDDKTSHVTYVPADSVLGRSLTGPTPTKLEELDLDELP